jgi:hypothetical protein
MSRVARVTGDVGRCSGGFYIEEPDIPEGLTCQEWRRRRRAEAQRPECAKRPRAVRRWPALRVATP